VVSVVRYVVVDVLNQVSLTVYLEMDVVVEVCVRVSRIVCVCVVVTGWVVVDISVTVTGRSTEPPLKPATKPTTSKIAGSRFLSCMLLLGRITIKHFCWSN
jgi:hypothetical protein